MRRIYRWFLALLLAGVGFTIVHGAPLPAQQEVTGYDSRIGPHFSVRIHPDGPLYVGDLLSFEVFSPPNLDLTEEDLKAVEIRLAGTAQAPIGKADFSQDSVNGGYRAVFEWVWDTSGLDPGDYSLEFTTSPTLFRWTEEVNLLPIDDKPPRLADAKWSTVETDCCIIHIITGTEGERDIEALKQMAAEETADVTARFNTQLEDPIEITFIPRVKGHGGFAASEVYVSYLDRNYAGSTTRQVLRHEIVHFVDGKVGGEYRPTMFVEGLAVYLSGGHFKPEPLMERAAALPNLGEFLALPDLADDFYANQHEAGYLEAGALIEYMVDTWGWDRFNAFYRGMNPPKDGEKPSTVIDAGLQEHLGLSLEELEERFRAYLQAQPTEDRWVEDVRLTIQYYDTVRRYQQVLDPSAYFRGVWLPSPTEMRKRGLVADYLRRPVTPLNQVLESLLVAADDRLRAGDYAQIETLLAKVNHALDAQENLQVYQSIFDRATTRELQ